MMANRIGKGKTKISLPALIRSVVTMEAKNAGSAKTFWKFFSPIQGLPNMPSFAIYLRKASVRPKIGI